MVSPVLSSIAGAILAPILPQFVLNKLLDSLFEYLSKDQPSSSGHADKLQQLDNERKAFAMANRKLEILQSEVRRLHKRDKQNMRLIDINNNLRDVSCQIKDLKDDLEYMELQRKVEEINLHDEAADKNPSTALQLLSSITPWKTGGSSDKRRRISSSESTDDIVNKMRTITEQINCIYSEMRFEIKLDALKGGYNSCGQHQVAENKRVTTSSPTESKIYGRDYEFSQLIQLLLKEPNVSGNVSVVPIVGMGGIGKTTLAQFVFNSTEIANHFEKKAWIYVSDYFDRFRITKEILDSLSIDEVSSPTVTTNLDVLEREIKRLVTEKKFLLVLDDVWSDEWRELLNFLGSVQAKAIKLILTCRDPKISGVLADRQNQINLEGLSDEDYWLFFMKCAFADENPYNYPQQLYAIGKQIVGKLKGSPLAAKTVGRLLGSSLTEEHWTDILESDLWKLKTDANGIMSALALSFYHLHQPLQLCFTFCSVFPKGFEYDMNSVISMWVAHGFIQKIEGSSKTLEDIGEEHWHELEARGFFENFNRYFKMHDLLHDLAQSISHGKTYIYEGKKDEEIPKDVCHLYAHSFFDLELVCKTDNLRTLILYGAGDIHAILNHRAFKRIRVLVISGTNVEELPDDIADLNHLQYLDLKETNIKSIPESVCTLYLLRVLKLACPPPTLPSRFHNLINLRRFCMHFCDFKNNLQIYHVNRERGYQIAQLRNMNELRGELLIGGLENIHNMEEVMKAKYLKEKRHIKQLQLRWEDTMNGCKHDVQEQVLEALQPHPNLKYLLIDGYMGFKSPNWLMTPEFQRLKNIKLKRCRKWALPAPLGLLPSLETLALSRIENMTIEGMSSSSSSSSSATGQNHNHFPKLTSLTIKESEVNGLHLPLFSALKYLGIKNSRVVFDQLAGCLNGVSSLSNLILDGVKIQTFPAKVMATLHALVKLNISKCNELISLEGLQALPSLQQLSIVGCSKFISWGMEEEITENCLTLPNLQIMEIYSCEYLESLPAWLPCLPLLNVLRITSCPKFKFWGTEEEITEDGLSLPNLEYMTIDSCEDLETLPAWLPRLPLLNRLIITNCPKFKFWGMEEEITEDRLPLPNLQLLDIESCKDLETLPAWLPRLPLLNKLIIAKCLKFKCWGTEEEITKNGLSLPNLQYLKIYSCEYLETLPAWFPRLPFLNQLIISGCPKFRCWGTEEITDGLPLPNLQCMIVEWCKDLETLPAWLPCLPLLNELIISGCPKFRSWGTKEEIIENGLPLPNLKCMTIDSCKDMETMPSWLPRLPSLNELIISGCPKFRSWGTKEEITEDGLLLPNLQFMKIESFKNLETLPAWLPRLPLLKLLFIRKCPKVHSLPKGGLPSSLEKLNLIECNPSLKERCQQEGFLKRQMIQHVPYRMDTC